MTELENIANVRTYLLSLQDNICQQLSKVDGSDFVEDEWQHEQGGGGRTRVIQDGALFEKAGVNFSHVFGDQLPPAATLKRPELAGKKFQAMGVSLVVHPQNPFVPTSHMNVRFFVAGPETDQPIWWFGGGFDLTPYYGFEEDAISWHETAKQACDPFGVNLYAKYKEGCDDYFYLKHRNEQRGVGGLFFDDLNEMGFDKSFAFTQSVGDHFIKAYMPIVKKRRATQFNEQQKQWQLLRRGRYVEFNLVFDRGTLFGLQSGGRTESILMSMPPQVAWRYRAEPEEGTEEHRLLKDFIVRKDWI